METMLVQSINPYIGTLDIPYTGTLDIVIVLIYTLVMMTEYLTEL